MRVNRTLLYAGIFLVAIGGVVVAADLTAIGENILVGILRFWPVAIVAVGVGLVARRTRMRLVGGLLATAVSGLMLGSALAAAPRLSGFCTSDGASARATQSGTFDGPASVSVTTDCGPLDVSMTPGSGWRLDAPKGGSRDAVVNASGRSLAISAATRSSGIGDNRSDWNLSLPSQGVDDLSVTVNAGRASVHLGDASLKRLSISANAASVIVDASNAILSSFGGDVNVGSVSLTLGSRADMEGAFEVNLGELTICAPPDLGLRISSSGDASEFTVDGNKISTEFWQSPDYASATHHANFEVSVDFGSLQINTIGGCK